MAVVEEKKVGVWDKLAAVDRRWIYLISFLMIGGPLLFPLNLPIGVSPETAAIFRYIEQMPKGSIIALSMDFGSPLSENYPQARSVFAHALKIGMKVIIMGMWGQGATTTSVIMIDEMKAYAQKLGITAITEALGKYGERYVHLGLIPQSGTGVMQMAQVGVYPLLFPKDNYGNALETLPFNKAGKPITQFKASDIDLLVCFAAGTPGIEVYREYWWATGICKNLAIGAVGVSVAGYYPQMDAKIIIGIIPSTKGALEYDQLAGLVGGSGQSFATMDSQSLQHAFIIILLVVGNAGTIVATRRKRAT